MKRPNSTGPLQSGDFIPKPRPTRSPAAASGGKGGGNGGNHQPPRLSGASPSQPPKKPTLKSVFNAAAKKPHRPPTKTYDQKIAELRKKAEDKVLSVLSKDQRKMFREKVGETFDFGDANDPGLRRGGGRGDRGGRDRGSRPDRD